MIGSAPAFSHGLVDRAQCRSPCRARPSRAAPSPLGRGRADHQRARTHAPWPSRPSTPPAGQSGRRRPRGACTRRTRRPSGWRRRSGVPTTRPGREYRSRSGPSLRRTAVRSRTRECRTRRSRGRARTREAPCAALDDTGERRVEERLVLAELRGEAVAGIHGRAAAEGVLQRSMLGDQPGGPAPRRDRVDALDEASPDERPRAVSLPAGPPKAVKLRNECGYFGGVEDLGDLGGCRGPCYGGNCQARIPLVWSRPPAVAPARGPLFRLSKRNLRDGVGRTRPPFGEH